MRAGRVEVMHSAPRVAADHRHAHDDGIVHDHGDGPHLHAAGQAHLHVVGGHGHSHGLVDRSIIRSRDGARTVSISLAVLGAAAVVPVFLNSWLNWIKFHTLFGISFDHQVATAVFPSRKAVLDANGRKARTADAPLNRSNTHPPALGQVPLAEVVPKGFNSRRPDECRHRSPR